MKPLAFYVLVSFSIPFLFMERTGVKYVVCPLRMNARPAWAGFAYIYFLVAIGASFPSHFLHTGADVRIMPVFSLFAAAVRILSGFTDL